jgi:predicted TIM-barrel fold metal-dependent hydrolase
MKAGRFVVDTHVHAQRFAAGAAVRSVLDGAPSGGTRWEALSAVMPGLEPYDNSEVLLHDMACYGVDRCVLLPAFGMTADLNLQIVERYPDRFTTLCDAGDYRRRVLEGAEAWCIEGVCAELDRLLATGRFVGIGEVMPYMPMPPDPRRPVSREVAVTNMLAIVEVAARHRVSVRYHTGCPMGYRVPYSSGELGPANFNPLWAHDLAAAFPDVPIIFDHGGIQGWWSASLQEECLHVAASHDNVYLECGLWWSELYERALLDPNVGPEKLLWGTDWGASLPFHSQPGHTPPSYAVQVRRRGPVAHQVDYWGWSLRELERLRLPQDDLNLILGGNAARVFRLDLPHRRLFRDRDV